MEAVFMPDNNDRIVIITGAVGTLGVAVGQKFLDSSANLVLTARGVGRLNQLFPELSDSNQHLLADDVDVTNPNTVSELIEKVIDQFKHIDVLVNTVGGFHGGTTLLDTHLDTLDSMFNLNSRSVFVTSQAVLPHMLKEKHGKII
jgi:NADP-dependent 3-hydroxy acid dehydrogenase YdfG